MLRPAGAMPPDLPFHLQDQEPPAPLFGDFLGGVDCDAVLVKIVCPLGNGDVGIWQPTQFSLGLGMGLEQRVAMAGKAARAKISPRGRRQRMGIVTGPHQSFPPLIRAHLLRAELLGLADHGGCIRVGGIRDD